MKKLLLVLIASMIILLMGCNWHDDIKEIEASQTAFLLPLEGRVSEQAKLASEDYLKSNQVAGKRIRIPKTRIAGHGYQPTVKLVIVERKPETREWTESEKQGTSSKNEGVTAESKESIGFMARVNCSAQIDEVNAAKFLYRYNNKPLAAIMDTEIRARIESVFVSECAKLTLEEIQQSKGDIIKKVKDDVVAFFAERGITITVLGLKGEFTYLNQEIQKSIDNKYKSAQDLVMQKNENERVLSKAKADSDAAKIQAEAFDKLKQVRQLDNEKLAIEKWDGKFPQYMGSGQTLFNIGGK